MSGTSWFRTSLTHDQFSLLVHPRYRGRAIGCGTPSKDNVQDVRKVLVGVNDAAGNNQPCDDRRGASEMPVIHELVNHTVGKCDALRTITNQQTL